MHACIDDGVGFATPFPNLATQPGVFYRAWCVFGQACEERVAGYSHKCHQRCETAFVAYRVPFGPGAVPLRGTEADTVPF